MIYRAHQRLGSVWRHRLPYRTASRKGAGQAVIVAVLDAVIELLKGADLAADLFLFLLRQLIQVELIAEGTRHGHASSGGKGRHPPGLVVGYRGHMSAHGADRIAEGGAILNLQAFDSICIVTAPDLRRVV